MYFVMYEGDLEQDPLDHGVEAFKSYDDTCVFVRTKSNRGYQTVTFVGEPLTEYRWFVVYDAPLKKPEDSGIKIFVEYEDAREFAMLLIKKRYYVSVYRGLWYENSRLATQ